MSIYSVGHIVPNVAITKAETIILNALQTFPFLAENLQLLGIFPRFMKSCFWRLSKIARFSVANGLFQAPNVPKQVALSPAEELMTLPIHPLPHFFSPSAPDLIPLSCFQSWNVCVLMGFETPERYFYGIIWLCTLWNLSRPANPRKMCWKKLLMAFFVQSWQPCQKVSLWAILSESPGCQRAFEFEVKSSNEALASNTLAHYAEVR